MNDKQIAFIICVNDDLEYAECQYYLSRLKVPEGFSTDFITIREASSMAEGYNAGMQSSNAGYKVYMHQDTFIINENFIADVVEAFAQDEEAAMLGVVGCRNMPEHAIAVSAWDTGRVCHNFQTFSGCQNGRNVEVDAVDGLLMVTRRDIPWREDLFTDWHYYDVSQCYEFKRAGYKVIVPYQKECWCYHDNKKNLIGPYMKWRDIFIREYSESFSFDTPIGVDVDRCLSCEQMDVELKENIAKLIDLGKMNEVVQFLNREDVENIPILNEYQVIKNIMETEQKAGSEIRFYDHSMDYAGLMKHFKILRHCLKRVEYGKEKPDPVVFYREFSVYAAMIMANAYCDDLDTVQGWIAGVYRRK